MFYSRIYWRESTDGMGGRDKDATCRAGGGKGSGGTVGGDYGSENGEVWGEGVAGWEGRMETEGGDRCGSVYRR